MGVSYECLLITWLLLRTEKKKLGARTIFVWKDAIRKLRMKY